MADIIVLQSVLTKIKQSKNKNLSEKVYQDEPILMRASQMENYTPAMYQKMRRMAVQLVTKTESEVFYKQAKFMEYFEDDCYFKGEFHRYYPTFRGMTDAQLRGYFTWRTQVRKGDIRKTSLSYVYVYIYELLHVIGYDTPQEAFLQLMHFWNVYQVLDPCVVNYKIRWLKDFCIYYNLPKDFLQKIEKNESKGAVQVLLNSDSESDADVFASLASLSTYRILDSAFYKANKEEFEAVTTLVVHELNQYYQNNSRFSSTERFFGTFCEGKRMLFSGAVFFDRLRHENYSYQLSESEKYTVDKGIWRYSHFVCYTGKNQPAGNILRSIDSKLRIKTGYKKQIKTGAINEEFSKIIDRCIEDYYIKKRFRAAEKIEIDISLLATIRKDANETCESLLTESQEETEKVIIDVVPVNKTGLQDLHFQFLLRLLKKESCDDLLQQSGMYVSILADAVNEALFDQFGDTVICFEGDTPVIIEDYIEDLKGFVGL